jgi:hypothetical protein
MAPTRLPFGRLRTVRKRQYRWRGTLEAQRLQGKIFGIGHAKVQLSRLADTLGGKGPLQFGEDSELLFSRHMRI